MYRLVSKCGLQLVYCNHSGICHVMYTFGSENGIINSDVKNDLAISDVKNEKFTFVLRNGYDIAFRKKIFTVE